MVAPNTKSCSASESTPKRKQSDRLIQLHNCVKHWLGDYHDLDAIDAVLAAVAVERLQGEPFWLLVLDAASTGKTETVSIASKSSGVECVSTFTSYRTTDRHQM